MFCWSIVGTQRCIVSGVPHSEWTRPYIMLCLPQVIMVCFETAARVEWFFKICQVISILLLSVIGASHLPWNESQGLTSHGLGGPKGPGSAYPATSSPHFLPYSLCSTPMGLIPVSPPHGSHGPTLRLSLPLLPRPGCPSPHIDSHSSLCLNIPSSVRTSPDYPVYIRAS